MKTTKLHFNETRLAFIMVGVTSFQLVAAPVPAKAPPATQPDESSDPRDESEFQFEVVVTGTRVETENLDVPADVRVTSRKRIQRPGTHSTLDALSEVSGVKQNARQKDASFTDLEVRGLSSNATSGGNLLVLLDGIPQRRLSFGGPYMGALPHDTVMRLELVKGPVSALYGRNALSGALQLFSNPGSTELLLDAMTAYEYPTRMARTSVRAAGPIGEAPIGGHERSTFSLTSSFGYGLGWQPRNERQRTDLYLHTELRLSARDKLTLLAGYFVGAEEYVAPVFVDERGQLRDGFEYRTNIAVPDQNSLNLREARIGLRHEHTWLENVRTKLTAAYWHGNSFWKVGRPSDQPTSGDRIPRSASDREFLESATFTEAELSFKYDGLGWLNGSLNLGASYEFLTYDMRVVQITTEEALTRTGGYGEGIPLEWPSHAQDSRSQWRFSDLSRRNTREHDAGLFLRKQVALFDRVFVTAGVRYDYFNREQLNPATDERAHHDDWALSPSVGVNGAVLRSRRHKLNVFASWGRGFSPIFRAVNNTAFADVEPETSESFDAGVKAVLFGRMIEATLVAYQLNRNQIVAMNPTTLLQENIGSWRVRGIETDWRARPIKPLTVYVGYTWRKPVIAEIGSDPTLKGNQIPAIAEHAAALGAEGRGPFGFSGGSEIRFVSERFGNEQNSFRLPAYYLWDAWLSYDVRDQLRVALFVQNILDEKYFTTVFNRVEHGSAFAGPPRTAGIVLRAIF